MAEDFLKEIEIVAPKKKKINFCGEIVEIAFVPSKVTIETARISDALNRGEISEYEGLMGIIDNVLSVCKSNPNITADWLMENTSFEMQVDFIAAASGNKNKGSGSTDAEKN